MAANFPIISTIATGSLAVFVLGIARPALASTPFGEVISFGMAGATVYFFSSTIKAIEDQILASWQTRSS